MWHNITETSGTITPKYPLGQSSEILKLNNFLYPIFSNLNDNNQEHLIYNQTGPFDNICKSNPEKLFGNIIGKNNTQEKVGLLRNSFISQFVHEIELFTGENLIISAESISTFSFEELSFLKQFLYDKINRSIDFNVVAFVRNPTTRIPSTIQQRVRIGQVIDKQCLLFTQKENDKFAITFPIFEKVFGKENIFVYKFEDSISHKFGPAGFFLEQIGFNKDVLPSLKYTHANSSISYEAAVIISAINEKIPMVIDGELNQQRGIRQRRILMDIPGVKFSINQEQMKLMWENSLTDLEWLYENYLVEPYAFCKNLDTSLDKRWGIETFLYLKSVFSQLELEIQKIIFAKIVEENADALIKIILSSDNDDVLNKIKLFFPPVKKGWGVWLKNRLTHLWKV